MTGVNISLFSLLKVSSLLVENVELFVSMSVGGRTNKAKLTLIREKKKINSTSGIEGQAF